MKYIDGNILDFARSHYIVHQCNCTTRSARGLAEQIFKRFPDANIYGNRRQLGTIIIRGNIINLVGQYYPSKPNATNDSASTRMAAFQNCLDQIGANLPKGAKIAFPYKIGCGLAGGQWRAYEKMILEFEAKNPTFEVLIVKLKL